MKIKLDENVSAALCHLFASRGIEADTVYTESLQGSSDDTIFRRAHEEGRLFITCDIDFADIRLFPPSISGGIVVLRLSNRSTKSILKRIEQLLEAIPLNQLRGATTIVSETRIRMRR